MNIAEKNDERSSLGTLAVVEYHYRAGNTGDVFFPESAQDLLSDVFHAAREQKLSMPDIARLAQSALNRFAEEVSAQLLDPEQDAADTPGLGQETFSVYGPEDNARSECPECGTLADEDGYCTDVGCVNVGKTVGRA